MIFFILIVLFLMFSSAKIAPANSFMKDYLSKEKTSSVKGVFVILILFSHYSQYVSLGGIYDDPYLILKAHLNQMVVAMFLFYSGYGMVNSIIKKGFDYVKTIPVRRFLRVWTDFAIAIVLFLIADICLGKFYDIPTILWSLIGWKNVGNSNWYMFVVFVIYWLLFVSFLHLKRFTGKCGIYVGMAFMTLLSVGFVLCLIRMRQPTYYYNTIILFALGGWFALLKDKIDKILLKNDCQYALVCTLMMIAYFLSFRKRFDYGIEGYSVWAVVFTLLIVLFTMKISICNPLLDWFGNHVFSIYILQRIPMMILQYLGLADSHKYFFLVLSFMFTVLIAMVFDFFMSKFSVIRKNRIDVR